MSNCGTFLMGMSAGMLVVVALLWQAVKYFDEGNKGETGQ